MMKKNVMRLFSTVCASAVLLAGCGADVSVTGVLESSSDGSAAPQTGGGKELTYWSMWNSTEGQAKVIQEAADAYEKETGIKINIEWKGRDIKTLIGPALDAGEKIDFFDQGYTFVVEQCGKYIADLTEMAQAVDYEKHAIPVVLDAVKEAGGGTLKAIAYQPYTTGVWYNQDMFEKAGIQEAPKTFDDLLKVCDQLKKAGVNPMTCDAGDGNTLLYGYQLSRYIGQEAVLDLVKNNNWGDVPEVEKAAQDIYTLFEKGYMSEYAPANYPDGQNEIGFEESAMILQASWIPNEVIQNTGTKINWGFFPWPSVPGGVDGAEASMVGTQCFAIVDKSEYKQEAFDFILSVVTGENDLKMAQAVSSIPADTENTEWPGAVAGAEPYFKDMTKAYKWAVGLQNNQDNKDIILDAINKLCKMEVDGKGFVDELVKNS